MGPQATVATKLPDVSYWQMPQSAHQIQPWQGSPDEPSSAFRGLYLFV